ncbi:MAG: PAS domain S-box protein [Desulfobacteraceae bacterium]|nr:MAG: PAS domain S-box protein [Desulfobacteraceae bacterium]
MGRSDLQISQSELSGRLKALMLLRFLFVTLLLGALTFIQIKETQTYFGYIHTSHYLLIATIYFLTFIYAIIFRYSKNLLWLAYSQLLVDTFFVTAIIYVTGGIESIFSFLYILTIINGSIILYRKGGMLIASSSSILYGLLIDLHYYGVIHPLGRPEAYDAQYQSPYIFFLILANIAGFYLVAYLSSYLSEQARKSRFELKAKQIDIDKLEVLNESIINSITSGLIVLDDQNRIILFNPAAEKIFGIKTDQAFGQQIDQALPFLKNHLVGIQPPSFQTPKKVPPFIDLSYLRPNGEKIPLRFSTSLLRLPRVDRKGNILIFQDMTEVMEIEEEMKKVEGLALVGELAAGIAHEIRNPMASISGSIQMLRDGLNENDVNSRLMDIVSREIVRLNHLVNNFLLFARPKKANFQEFDLNQVIHESLELFKNSHHWAEKTKALTAFQNNIRFKSDPEQIKQVLWNLFLNACEAMPDGGSFYVMTRLEPDVLQSDQKQVKIIVRDTGGGFDNKVLSQAFIPFFTTKDEGSGLGLAIVKRIVEGLQGKVYAGNHAEGGAEISIVLPISPSDFPSIKET